MKLYDAISDEAEERGKEELRNEELKKKLREIMEIVR